MTDAMMTVARPLAETEAIATITTAKTIPVIAAQIRDLVVREILVLTYVDGRL